MPWFAIVFKKRKNVEKSNTTQDSNRMPLEYRSSALQLH